MRSSKKRLTAASNSFYGFMNTPQKLLSQPDRQSKITGLLFCFVLLILTILCYSAHLYSSDEGSVTNLAWHWWNHQAVYIDFHEFIPPGAPLLVLAGWKLFGLSYLGAKIPFIFIGFLSVFFTYLITYRLTRKNTVALFAAYFWLAASGFYPAINHNTLGSFLAVILTYFLIFPFENRKNVRLIIIGIINALILWTLQTKGFTLFAASIFVLITEKRDKNQKIGIFILCFMASSFLLYSPWPLEIIWHNLVVLPFQMDYLGSSFYNYTLYFVSAIFLIIMWLTYRKTQARPVFVLFALQLALFLSMFNNFDIFHFMINIAPFLIMMAAYPLLRPKRRLSKLVANYTLLFFVSLFYFLFAVGNLRTSNIFYSQEPEIFSKITQNSENVYAGPFIPGFYFELRKINYFDTYSNEVYCNTDKCQQQALGTFKRISPEYAILGFEMTTKYNYFLEDSAVGTYVVQNYKICGDFEALQIYARDDCLVK